MITFESVSKVYNPVTSWRNEALGTTDQDNDVFHSDGLRSLSLKIKKGEFLFIAGTSGAGKTTLLRLLYGASLPSQGTVTIDTIKITPQSTNKELMKVRKSTGVIFQDYKLLPRRNVLENISLGLEIRGIKKKERNELCHHMLEVVGLEKKANAMPAQLSGGEQQRVAIARSLIYRPKVLCADEPTGNLDPRLTNEIFDLLTGAHKLGVTVIVATHNLEMIEERNERTVVLEKGTVLGDFPRDEKEQGVPA